MRDDVKLEAKVYTTVGGAQQPVILVRTPYSEPMSRSLPIIPLLDAGFAVVVQNCRGTGGSEGELWAFENETNDGLDTIAWLVDQPWTTGQVCMFGGSYLGMSQLAVSGHRPNGLVAIAPTITTHNYRDGLVYRQGVPQLGQGLGWHILKTAQTLGDRATRGEDFKEQMEAFAAMTSDMETAYRTLPLTSLHGVNDVLPSWQKWLEKEKDAQYWNSINFTDHRTKTGVPGMHVGGWFDLFLGGTLDNYRVIAQQAETVQAQANQHLVVGPWTHTDQTGTAGELFFPNGSAPIIRLEDQQRTFLSESVAAGPSSIPPVQIFVMGANHWRTENEWPLARTEWQKWYFQANGGLSTQTPKHNAEPVEYTHDPHDPVPTVGGSALMNGGPDGSAQYMPGARDQRVLDGRDDILRFISEALVDDLEVTGPLSVTLQGATSAADTDFTAKLIDVWPDGRAMWVADGIVRSRYRNGMDRDEAIEPGQIYEYSIDLVATSQVFQKGHRLRVDIASSNFPCFDRNSGSGKPVAEVTEDDLVTAHQQVFSTADHPSYITLPIIP